MLLGVLGISVYSQDYKMPEFPPNYQPDTRIDNMGYWGKMAELGLVPVQPMYKPAPAKFTGTRVFNNHRMLISDSPDVPVTTNVNTESENSIFGDPNNNMHVLESNNSTPQPSGGSTYGADWYNSFDGGSTWNGSYQGAGIGNWGDPAACINLSGRYFVGYITSAGHQGVSYSDNNGTTWSHVIANSGGNASSPLDKNHLWVDNSATSPFVGNLYDGWMNSNGQIAICRSITNGTTWKLRRLSQPQLYPVDRSKGLISRQARMAKSMLFMQFILAGQIMKDPLDSQGLLMEVSHGVKP